MKSVIKIAAILASRGGLFISWLILNLISSCQGRLLLPSVPLQEEEHQVEVAVDPRVNLQRALQHRVGQCSQGGEHRGGGAVVTVCRYGNQDQLEGKMEYFALCAMQAMGQSQGEKVHYHRKYLQQTTYIQYFESKNRYLEFTIATKKFRHDLPTIGFYVRLCPTKVAWI